MTLLLLTAFIPNVDSSPQTRLRVFIGEILGPDPTVNERYKGLAKSGLGKFKEFELVVSEAAADYVLTGYGLLEVNSSGSMSTPATGRSLSDKGVVPGARGSSGDLGSVTAKLVLRLTGRDGQVAVSDTSATGGRSGSVLKDAVISALKEIRNQMKKPQTAPHSSGRPSQAGRVVPKSSPPDTGSRLPVERTGPAAGPRSVLWKSPAEMVAAFPELRGLDSSEPTIETGVLLKKTGERVAALFHDFPNLSSVESIRMERLGADGGVADQRAQSFNYMLSRLPGENEIGLEEYRTNSSGERVSPSGPAGTHLLTSGYAVNSIYFHPEIAPECDFRYLGRETAGQRRHVIGFLPRAEGRLSRAQFTIGDISTGMDLQGIAWIEPDSFQIVRMRTDLVEPNVATGLFRHTTEVRFGEVRLGSDMRSMWLPDEVVVTLVWQGTTFRNRHRYSEYRRFTVESIEGDKKPARR